MRGDTFPAIDIGDTVDASGAAAVQKDSNSSTGSPGGLLHLEGV